jgi:hypothetical protein
VKRVRKQVRRHFNTLFYLVTAFAVLAIFANTEAVEFTVLCTILAANAIAEKNIDANKNAYLRDHLKDAEATLARGVTVRFLDDRRTVETVSSARSKYYFVTVTDVYDEDGEGNRTPWVRAVDKEEETP